MRTTVVPKHGSDRGGLAGGESFGGAQGSGTRRVFGQEGCRQRLLLFLPLAL